MTEENNKVSLARQRIIDAADRLFYEEGIRSVGIDRIIAEANVAKMSLYKHFASKDELILEVLKYREERMGEFFKDAVARHAKTKKSKLLAFFAALEELLTSKGFRGCPFQNAASELADAEHPGSKFVREQKNRFLKRLEAMVEDAVGPIASEIAPVIFLLVEGAIITAAIQGKPSVIKIARDAAMKLLNE